MNFLLRSAHSTAADHSHETSAPPASHPPRPKPTLEGLIAEDPYLKYPTTHVDNVQYDRFGSDDDGIGSASEKDELSLSQNYSDVSEEEGWIAIPKKEVPHDWKDATEISCFRALDRSFVFPGEQVHILACLSSNKVDTEIVTPFKVAAVMTKNGMQQTTKKQNGDVVSESISESRESSPTNHVQDQNGELLVNTTTDDQDVSSSESLLRMEDHRRQTEVLLQTFKNSHFFVRIAESDVQLWSKSTSHSSPSESDEKLKRTYNVSSPNGLVDREDFNANVSGGVARDIVECCSLPNGDIVVLIQVNVGVDLIKDPILEILQFEKYQDRDSSYPQNGNINSNGSCGELLKWLLPLDNTIPPPSRSLSPPPPFSSSSGSGSATLKSSFSASFGHFRSYSMSSLPQNSTSPLVAAKTPSSKPEFNLEDWDRFSSQNSAKSQTVGKENLLSFRGVSLEPDRFSVSCGLEGIYIPGRRWRKKLEIVQPVEIYSFAADCNTDDLICVQIKNICPEHISDMVIYVDAITIVFEEASKGGPPLSLPLACIEAGNEHSLPNLALRRGEIHSFLLKPATSASKNLKSHADKSIRPSHLPAGSAPSNVHLPSKILDCKSSSLVSDQYSVMISCRSNYTESRLFFKQFTSWRPRVSRDLMISVASEICKTSLGSSGGKVSQLPVQVLTLQASNFTPEDLTLTVLAPASFTAPPSVVSLNSSPTSPVSPFIGFAEFAGKLSGDREGSSTKRSSFMPVQLDIQKQYDDKQNQKASPNEQVGPISDVIPSTSSGCSHLWLQSRVPLGCVPSGTMATIKLELLPLTDGIITLDTLQVHVKEKGVTYIPEQSLKINATSSISSGIL